MANQNSTKYEKCIGLRLTSSSEKRHYKNAGQH